MNAQFKKGVLELMVLAAVSTGDTACTADFPLTCCRDAP